MTLEETLPERLERHCTPVSSVWTYSAVLRYMSTDYPNTAFTTERGQLRVSYQVDSSDHDNEGKLCHSFCEDARHTAFSRSIMSTTDQSDDNEQFPKPEAPQGWHWGLGARRSNGYDTWLYTDKVLYEDHASAEADAVSQSERGSDMDGAFGWEAHAYQDNGGDHHVEFIQITQLKENGDLEYSYPKHQCSFDTEEDAIAYLVSKAKELRS